MDAIEELIFKTLLANQEQGALAGEFSDAGVDRVTIYRRLKDLESRRLVTCEPISSRSSRYRLTNDGKCEAATIYLSLPTAQRKIVPFSMDRLRDYQPNVTRLISEPDAAELYQAGSIGDLELSRKSLEAFLIDLSFESARMEGSTLNMLETTVLIQYGESRGMDQESVKLVLAHKAAIANMIDNELSTSPRDLMDLHRLVTKGAFPKQDDEPCGRLRERIVRIAGSSYVPSVVPTVTKEAFEMCCEKAQQIEDPIEASAFLMLMLPYIQPFDDGNKRLSRIALNIPLLQANLCPMSFTHLPAQEYLRGILAFYELGTPRIAVKNFAQGYRDGVDRFPEIQARTSGLSM